MNPDERELYKILFMCKEALTIILEEAETDQTWSIVLDVASDALDAFEN